MRFDRIRDLREDADMTQSEIGLKLQISQRAYAHYENGTRDIPLEIIVKLADLYDVNIDYLLNRTEIRDRYPTKK